MVDTVVTVNQTGGTPDFTSIQAALDVSDVTPGRYVVQVQDASTYVENLTVTGSTGTPSITNHVVIEADVGVYHAGVLGSGMRVHPNGGGDVIMIREDFVHLLRLELVMDASGGNGEDNVDLETGDTYVGTLVEMCLLDGQARVRRTRNGNNIHTDLRDHDITVYNSCLHDSDRCNIYHNRFGGSSNIEFCTLYQSVVTTTADNDKGNYMASRTSGSPARNVYNTVVANTTTGLPGEDYRNQGSGTPTDNASNNASGDASAIGTGPIINLDAVAATVWTDPANLDLSLLDTNSPLYGAGDDRSATLPDPRITTAGIDITGATRPNPPSIGAYDIAATGGVVKEGQATLAGSATLSADGERSRDAQASLVGSATLTADGTTSAVEEGQATLTASAALSADGERSRTGAAILAATGVLTADGLRIRNASTTLSGVAALSAIADTEADEGQAVLAAAAALSADAERQRSGATTLTASAALAAAGGLVREAQATNFGAATLDAAAERTRDAQAALTGVATLSALGDKEGESEGFATLTASSSLAATATRLRQASATFAGSAAITADGSTSTLKEGQATLAGSAAITADGRSITSAAATLDANGALVAAGSRQRLATTVLAATGALSAEGARERQGAVVLNALAVLTATDFLQPPDEIALDGRFQVETQLEGSVRSPPVYAKAC